MKTKSLDIAEEEATSHEAPKNRRYTAGSIGAIVGM